MTALLDRVLDASIVASFDRTGFARHARRFRARTSRDLAGTTALVTGGTAGIGLQAAQALIAAGATTHLWGRNEERGAAAVDDLGPNARFTSVDLGELATIAEALPTPEGPLSAVILCAGAMPRARTLTSEGHELTWASQVLGHLLLLRHLRARDQLTEATRIVWVSSGGMYLQPLDLSDLQRVQDYQRHTVYANAKRAQVMLNAILAARWPEVWTGAMHPGWVDTAAVQHSMPWFRAITRPILRTPDQGADTIAWLACTADAPPSGRFWFDRAEAPVHHHAGTERSSDSAEALWEAVTTATDPYLD